MSEKYLSAGSPATTSRCRPMRVITNDLFLAAFLYTVNCELTCIEKNGRRRVSFVFVGERVRELREAYRAGPVRVDMLSFRENLNRFRDFLGGKSAGRYPDERSMPCPTESLMKSSRV